MATARPKISLKIRVLRDEKTAGDWGKLFDESVNVQLVIDWSMEKAAAQTQSRLEFQRVEACLSEEALERRGTELDAGDLSEMTVADLRDSFGRFLKVHCLTDAASSTPTQLPSAFDSMREAQRKSDQRDKPLLNEWPGAATGKPLLNEWGGKATCAEGGGNCRSAAARLA